MTTKSTPARTWAGKVPTVCQCCNRPIVSSFSDIRSWRGQWMIACDLCVPEFASGRNQHYGTGLGQRYQRRDGKFYKTHG